MQRIYKKNLQNLICKPVEHHKNTDLQKQLFAVSKENEMTKITEEDVEQLERYEKLLYDQN